MQYADVACHGLTRPTLAHWTVVSRQRLSACRRQVVCAVLLGREPVLLAIIQQAHSASVTALLVVDDRRDSKAVVSASLDKTLASWRVSQDEVDGPAAPGLSRTAAPPTAPPTALPTGLPAGLAPQRQLAATRLAAPGGPVFSLVRQPTTPPGSVFSGIGEMLYLGNAAKEVIAWEVNCTAPKDSGTAHFQTVATDYTGWVRALAMQGKYLFSCGCNFLVQHDTSLTALPKEVARLELFKGDIQVILASPTHVYAASADGSLRSWSLAKTGTLKLVAEVQAHDSRITGLALHEGMLFSSSLDGRVRCWRGEGLTLAAEAVEAHGGEKVHTIAMGADGLLYTGGDDKLIRRWQPTFELLHPAEPASACVSISDDDNDVITNTYNSGASKVPSVAPSKALMALGPAGLPLSGHTAGVRVLAAGSSECLVSGDGDGCIMIWALAGLGCAVRQQ